MESVSTRSTGWLSDVAGGLQAILTSRIDPARRNKAIHLAAMLTHLLGVSWAIETNVKFFMILVNLVSVVRPRRRYCFVRIVYIELLHCTGAEDINRRSGNDTNC